MNVPADANSVYLLLVDDLDENLRALEALLRREGLILLQAHSGAAALEMLLLHDVALALVDVQMPDMDGFELAELMRGTQRTRRVPIIFLTATTPTLQRRFRGYEAGAVDFLQKPLEPDILRSKVDVFVELYRQRQEVARQRDELRTAIEENTRLLGETQQYAAALREGDRRKDEFLATLAHELRNPLAPIQTAVHILQQLHPSPEEAGRLHEVIGRQVSHMVRLVDELLEVSRITQGKVQLQRAPIDLAEVVRQAVETSQPLIDAKFHDLEIVLPPTPLMVEGDSVRLTQVLANLLNNAAKYTPERGQIHLSVEAGDHAAILRVKDSGVGIPQNHLESVFEMFTQLHQNGEHAAGGLGIGLTLVKSLVELHGGQICVSSEGEGQGSEFTVSLPLLTNATATSGSDAGRCVTPSAARRVLIIDDNTDAANCLRLLLRALGHSVAVASDGLSGIQQVEAFQPEVIFLDLGMPGMDGFETAQLIRQTERGEGVTIAALTGWGHDDFRRRTKEVGFEYHLLKPVEIHSLREILSESRPVPQSRSVS